MPRSTAYGTIVACALAMLLSIRPAGAQSPIAIDQGTGLCGPIENANGPFDYRTATPAQRKLVEDYHFTPSVETLRAGRSGLIGSDLDYTLRAFPNHARALYAMSRYSNRLKATRVPGARYPVECYFDRAIRFAPDDGQPRALYADYLIRHRRLEEARTQLVAIEKISTAPPQVLYNAGLAWFDLKEYEKALTYAKQAYAAGVTFPGLRDKLKRVGHWRDSP